MYEVYVPFFHYVHPLGKKKKSKKILLSALLKVEF